jgi:signal peptidase I
VSNPFVERKPWAAALVALVTGPVIAMAYLNRGWYALGYLAVQTLIVATVIVWDPRSLTSDAGNFYVVATLAIHLAGIGHSVLVAHDRDPAERMRWYSRWPALAAFVLLPIAVAFAIRTLFFQPFCAPSESMLPALDVDDCFYADKRAYNSAPPQRGDVIVFRAHNGAAYIKRVVGVPGDRVQMKDGRFYLNGLLVPQRSVGLTPPGATGYARGTELIETLPGGRSYRVLDLFDDTPSDNTDVYAVPPRHYFVMGDNRDNSVDSRGEVGLVSEDDIIGKAAFVWWNQSGGGWINRPIR